MAKKSLAKRNGHTVTTASAASQALDFGKAWDYAPAPESPDRPRQDQAAVTSLFIGGKWKKPASGKYFGHDLAVDGAEARGHRGRQRGGRRPRGDRRAPGARQVLGEDAGGRAREVHLPHRPGAPGEGARARHRRVDGRRQAHQGVARRGRPARGGALLLSRGLGGQARLRLPRAHRAAARGRGADHPVELPAADGRVEARAGAGLRQHGGAQARGDDAAHGAAPRAHHRGGRASARRRQHRHGRWRHGGSARGSRGSRQGGLHGLDRGRHAHPARARGDEQATHPRARRQSRQHRLCGRSNRSSGRGNHQGHLLQPGPRLLRRIAPARRGERARRRRPQAPRPHGDAPASAIRSTRTRTSAPSTRRCSSRRSRSS